MLVPLTSNAIFGAGPSSVTGVDDISGQIPFVGGRRIGTERAAQAAAGRCSSGCREATVPAFGCSGISVRRSPGLTAMQISSKPFDRRGIQPGDGSARHCRIGRLNQPALRPEADHISDNGAGSAPVGQVGAQKGNALRPAHGCSPQSKPARFPISSETPTGVGSTMPTSAQRMIAGVKALWTAEERQPTGSIDGSRRASANRRCQASGCVASKYLNNLIEPDHPGMKSGNAPTLGFNRFMTAVVTVAGIVLLLRIRKEQSDVGRLGLRDRRAPALRGAVMANRWRDGIACRRPQPLARHAACIRARWRDPSPIIVAMPP